MGQSQTGSRTANISLGQVQVSNIRKMTLDVAPPSSLSQPLVVPSKTLSGPGPSNCADRVLQAQSLPTLGHLHPEFCTIMDDIKAGVKYIFQTKNEASFALSATGHAAMECVMTNMFEPGKSVLICNSGIWGVRSADMARRQGAEVHEVTSTGVLQPLEGLGPLCHENNCLLAVDTGASLGGVPVYADQLEIDIIYTGSQKVLGVPPGTAPISFSPRAVAAFKARKNPPCSFYLDLGWLGEYWNCWPDKGRVYHHTAPVNSLYGLREGLAMVADEGLENCWRRHRLCADHLQS